MVSERKKSSKTSTTSPTKAATQVSTVVKLSKDEVFNVRNFPHKFSIVY